MAKEMEFKSKEGRDQFYNLWKVPQNESHVNAEDIMV